MSGRTAMTTRGWLAGALLALPGAGAAPVVASEFPPPFDAGAKYSRELHVDAAARAGGDGSSAAPLRTIAEALARATPGTRVRVAAGRYDAVGTVARLQGTAEAPIALVGSGEVIIDPKGKGSGLHLADPRYVVVEGIAITNAFPHGMNVDDGGTDDTPASHVVLRNVSFSRIGDGGNNDCLKMSGVDHFHVEGSRFAGCNRGEAIDMVGCHRGVIAGNTFRDMPGSAVQTKGGSSDVLIHGNRFTGIGERAVNAGGHTGRPYFRPLDARYEAARIRVIANVIERSGGAAVVFAGCDSCVFANNTIVHPGSYVARIVQENPERAVGTGGHFVNNVVVFAESRLRGHVDVAAGTRPETYTFGSNLWYAVDDEKFAGPDYPSGIPAEQGAIVGRNPLLDAARRPMEGSPALTPGRDVPGGAAWDFDRRPYGDPPNRGAFAGRGDAVPAAIPGRP